MIDVGSFSGVLVLVSVTHSQLANLICEPNLCSDLHRAGKGQDPSVSFEKPIPLGRESRTPRDSSASV
jgi:hypothetical protein